MCFPYKVRILLLTKCVKSKYQQCFHKMCRTSMKTCVFRTKCVYYSLQNVLRTSMNSVFHKMCRNSMKTKQSAYITPAYEKRRMTKAPISGSTDGEETETEEAKWRRGQSWNPNYSIIAPKSGPDSIYPVPPSKLSSSPSSLIYNMNMQ